MTHIRRNESVLERLDLRKGRFQYSDLQNDVLLGQMVCNTFKWWMIHCLQCKGKDALAKLTHRFSCATFISA